MTTKKSLNVICYLVVGFFIAILLLLTSARLNLNPPQGDGIENFTYAFNLSKYYVITDGSLDNGGEFIASNEREPFPIFLSAAWIEFNPYLSEIEKKDDLLKGKKLIQLKLQNVLYIFLILLGVFSLSNILIGTQCGFVFKAIFSITSVAIVYFCLPIKYVNNLLTEYQASFLLIWFIVFWLSAWSTKSTWKYLLTGIALGLLFLTKASFFYIAIISLSFFLFWLGLTKTNKKQILQNALILIFSILTVLPWYARNYVNLGIWELVQRGPVVLIVRAYKSRMTDEEFKGAFYAYAPASLKKIMSNITGYNERDRLTNGQLQRLTRYPIGDIEKREKLNEKDAISYYIQATTHYRVIYQNYLKSIHNKELARILTDQAIKKESFQIIKDNFCLHLRSSLVFSWRGLWPNNSTDGRITNHANQSIYQDLIPVLGFLSMVILFICGLINKNLNFVILTILGVGAFFFYALLTHFIPRYSIMTLPIWIVCGLYGFTLVTQRLVKSLHQIVKQ